jgi:hypothetical protein
MRHYFNNKFSKNYNMPAFIIGSGDGFKTGGGSRDS